MGIVTMKYLLMFCLIHSISGQSHFRPEGSLCTTPSEEPGVCKKIRACPQLISLLSSSKRDYDSFLYLRRSTCSFDRGEIVLCCPQSGTIITTASPPRFSSQRPQQNPGPSRPKSSLPSPPNCGVTEELDHDRIVGGTPAVLGAWPWIAALGYTSAAKPKPMWLCGGSLITQRYVLTAAHCTTHTKYSLSVVRVGDLNLDENVYDGASPVDIPVDRLIPHEQYSPQKYTDDIALVRMTQNVQLTPLIQPICLPHPPELRNKNYDSRSPFIAGWGSIFFKGPSSRQLLEAQVPVLSTSLCARSYQRQGIRITNRQICAGNLTAGIDACQGDSGGPLMNPEGVHFYQIGVVSFGFGCAEPDYPGIYTRVSEYIDWISQNIY